MQPSVEVSPPGAAARRHPTPKQRKAVQRVLRDNTIDLAKLDGREMRALLPVFRQAREEMSEQLRGWLHRTPNGDLRWSAWKYHSALAQLQHGVEHLELQLDGRLQAGGAAGQRLALEHLIHETTRFTEVFGGEVPHLNLQVARMLAEGRASLVPKYRSSAARYAWGSKYGVWHDINRRLAVDIMTGATVNETIRRLVRDGGPRGLVALRGVAGEEGAIVELIPEGLFARYESRAETYVRTEVAAAYSFQFREGLHDARRILPDLMRRWCCDGKACPQICMPMDGQVVALEQPFIGGDGSTIEGQPAHPRCRCREGAWRAHWPALLDSLGLN
jgi:hypothetical protein